MAISVSEAKRYLIREQGFDEEQLENTPWQEIIDLYEMYHEDYN